MHSRSSQSSYRDRTQEFQTIVERLKRSISSQPNPQIPKLEAPNSTAFSIQSEFNKRASNIGLGIHQTSQKLSKLAKYKMENSAKTTWGKQDVVNFIQCCIEERKNQGKAASFKKSVGWQNILIKFNQRNRSNLDYAQLKNKWDSLKKEWNLWKRLGRQTGVRWDPEKKTYTGDDAWWQAQVVAFGKDVQKFRNGPLNFEHQLDFLFGDITATGGSSYTPSSGVLPQSLGDEIADDGDGLNLNDINTPRGNYNMYADILKDSSTHFSPREESDDFPTFSEQMAQPSYTPEAGTSKKSNKRKASMKSGSAANIDNNISRLVDILEARNTKSRTSSASISKGNSVPSIYEVMKRVRELPGVNIYDEFYLEAADVMESSINREMFVALEDALVQRNWLDKKIAKEKGRRD